MHTSILFIFAALISACCGHIGGESHGLQKGPQYYCGRYLARKLALLCYDAPSSDKRSESGSMFNLILSPYYKDRYANSPWITEHKALGLSSRAKRQLVGIVSECCDKACSISELQSYC